MTGHSTQARIIQVWDDMYAGDEFNMVLSESDYEGAVSRAIERGDVEE